MAEFDLIKGDVNKEVANLREKPGKDIVVLGSGKLLRGLMKDGLVDAYILLSTRSYLAPDSGCSMTACPTPTSSSRIRRRPRPAIVATYAT